MKRKKKNPPDIQLTEKQRATRDVITYMLHTGRLQLQNIRAGRKS